MNSRRFGRVCIQDERDKRFLLAAKTSDRPRRYWWAGGWWGDQGNTSRCVAYAWLHWLEDGPVTHKQVPPPMIRAATLYDESRKLDEWPGEDYEGTSVRGAAKALKRRGLIGSYRWAFDIKRVVYALLEEGPLVVGTEWTDGMSEPDHRGLIRAVGQTLGGHAYLLDGINVAKQLVRIKNSWGRTWGRNGFAYIPFADLSKLLKRDGECCLAVEQHD